MPWGEPMFEELTYCTRCCMPETTEGIAFDELGVCQACQSAEQKIHIDWAARERDLRGILDRYRKSGRRLRLHRPDQRRKGQRPSSCTC